MGLQSALVLRDGVEHTRYSVGNVVTHHISHVEAHDDYAHERIYEIHVVGSRCVDVQQQGARYVVNQPFENQGCESAQDSGEKSKNHHKSPLLYVLLTPHDKREKHRVERV